MSTIRVLLADDHALFRSGLRALINGFSGITVVAEASNGREARQLASQQRPDVVLMDITMPDLNGLDATAQILRDVPGVKVLVLSMHPDEAYVNRALKAGATGYLLKTASGPELELAIRAVARGDLYLGPRVAKRVIPEYLTRDAERPGDVERLTPRQREILQLIAEGCTSKQIAQRLGLSVKTVERHRADLMNRLEIHDIAGLVRWAIGHGLVAFEI
ncbi:MAG TPA: response regulator transcription factor [Gemmatimonadales bacterium]|nr:response regulator transcription factor [Gemmatimonadales bacterium]